jgi:glycosyltransferase involved in cell wall biosynthesis
MRKNQKHLAFVMVNLRPGIDGAATAMLELMHYVKRSGFAASTINFLTGESQHRALLAERMSSKGSEPTIYHNDVYHYREREIDCHVRILPFTIRELGEKQSVVLKTITETISGLHVDYVLTVDPKSALAAHVLAIPGCHFFHSLANIQQVQSRQPIYLSILRSRDCAAISTFLQRKVKELLDIKANVLNPGIDFDAYTVPRDTNADAIGFYAGGTLGYKGDEIVSVIIEKMPDKKFIIVGKGYRHPFATLPGNVTYCGFQPDMREFYRQIKVVLVPSLVQEGFSRIVLEAAVNGVPAIANNTGGIPEALGESGVLIDLDSGKNPDIQQIAAYYVKEIRRLWENAGHYKALSKKALLRAQQYAARLENALGLFLQQHVQ